MKSKERKWLYIIIPLVLLIILDLFVIPNFYWILVGNELPDTESIPLLFDILKYFSLFYIIIITSIIIIKRWTNSKDNDTGKKYYKEEVKYLVEKYKESNRSIYIDGAFGIGKTQLLKELITELKENGLAEENILELKIYEDFLENDYISYLYNKLDGYKFKNIKILMILVSTYLSSLFIFSILNWKLLENYPWIQTVDKFLKNNIIFFVLLVFVMMIISLILEYQSRKIPDKNNYNIKKLKKKKLIILDDFDRGLNWRENKEILKLIHFITDKEELKDVKLIIVGDSRRLENSLLIDKFYDYKFVFPVHKKLDEMKKSLQILFDSNTGDIENALNYLTPENYNRRIHEKIKKDLEGLEKSNVYIDQKFIITLLGYVDKKGFDFIFSYYKGAHSNLSDLLKNINDSKQGKIDKDRELIKDNIKDKSLADFFIYGLTDEVYRDFYHMKNYPDLYFTYIESNQMSLESLRKTLTKGTLELTEVLKEIYRFQNDNNLDVSYANYINKIEVEELNMTDFIKIKEIVDVRGIELKEINDEIKYMLESASANTLLKTNKGPLAEIVESYKLKKFNSELVKLKYFQDAYTIDNNSKELNELIENLDIKKSLNLSILYDHLSFFNYKNNDEISKKFEETIAVDSKLIKSLYNEINSKTINKTIDVENNYSPGIIKIRNKYIAELK